MADTWPYLNCSTGLLSDWGLSAPTGCHSSGSRCRKPRDLPRANGKSSSKAGRLIVDLVLLDFMVNTVVFDLVAGELIDHHLALSIEGFGLKPAAFLDRCSIQDDPTRVIRAACYA